MLNSNKRIKFAHFQKGASQSMLNNTLATEMINFEKEKLGSFDKVKNVVIKKIENLAKYLRYSEVQKNTKVVNV